MDKKSKMFALVAQLKAEIALLKSSLAEKESIITERDSTISRISADLNAAKFQIEQLRRMIFGSKRERFESVLDSQQLALEFEPKALEIEESVKLIRADYLRRKPKKEHPGRLALPSHLPVVETIIEPSEDTTDMIHIGREVTEELDYTPGTLHVNRIIRNKYITKEDELGNQEQIIAQLNFRIVGEIVLRTASSALCCPPALCFQGNIPNDR